MTKFQSNTHIVTCSSTSVDRASKLLSVLQKEEMENLINDRIYPVIKPGDSVEVEMLPYSTAKTPDLIKGIVIGISNRQSDTIIKLINVRILFGNSENRKLNGLDGYELTWDFCHCSI